MQDQLNNVTIGDAPEHLITHCIGVLIGLGVDYRIDVESALHEMVKEYKRDYYLQLKEEGKLGDEFPPELGYRIRIKGGDEESIKVNFRPVEVADVYNLIYDISVDPQP